MYLILRLIINAAALWIVANFVPGVHVTSITSLIVVSIILGLVNAIIKPILIVLTLPLEILTLGLFTLIINAFLFWWVAQLHLGLTVDGWWPALWGSIILWLVSWILSAILTPRRV